MQNGVEAEPTEPYGPLYFSRRGSAGLADVAIQNRPALAGHPHALTLDA